MQAERGLSTARAIPCAACIVDRTFPGCCFALKKKEKFVFLLDFWKLSIFSRAIFGEISST